MRRSSRAPRVGLILLTLAGIALASAGLATAITMSVTAPEQAQSGLAAVTGGPARSGDRGPAPAPAPSASEAWKPLPVDPAVADRSIIDLTRGATAGVTVDVLGVTVSPGQAGALVATVLSAPLVIGAGVLVLARRPRRWWSRVVLRRHG